jgi:hypothetical protein
MKRDHGGSCIVMNFTACILHRILLGWLNEGGWGGRDMRHAWVKGEVFRGLWLGGPNVTDHWEDVGVGEMRTLRWTINIRASMGVNRIQLGQDRVLWRVLWTRQWNFGFRKERLLAGWANISFENNILPHGVSSKYVSCYPNKCCVWLPVVFGSHTFRFVCYCLLSGYVLRYVSNIFHHLKETWDEYRYHLKRLLHRTRWL